MPTNFLSVEREKSIVAQRAAANSRVKSVDVFNVEGEKNRKMCFQANERKLKALQRKKTVPELKAAIDGTKARIADSEERLKGLRGPNAVDEKKMATVEVGFRKYTEAWAKYKRVFGSLWDPVSEGMALSGKKERDVLADMGVDTDNAAKVDLKEFRALLTNKRARR